MTDRVTTETAEANIDDLKTLDIIIFENLVHNEPFARKVLPFLKRDYFDTTEKQLVFKVIENHVAKFKTLPTVDSLLVDLSGAAGIKESTFNSAVELCERIKKGATAPKPSVDWLVARTEEFGKQRALYNAMAESIRIIDEGEKSKKPASSIPTIITEALGVSFETRVGHDYTKDYSERFSRYTSKEIHIPSGIDELDKITGGGVIPKTLNCLLAGTGVGKTLVMCSLASNYIMSGRNVLYITAEMDEMKIAERVDANIMDIDLDDMKVLPVPQLEQLWTKATNGKKLGKLIVKEFPTRTAHVGHIRFLLKELEIKMGFRPDIVFFDYLNLFISQTIKSGAANSYDYVKAVAEEIRGLMMEYGLPGWTATQVNRTGYASEDIDMTDTSESFGVPMTLDLFIALMTNDDLQQQQRLLWKQLKNRYTDYLKNPRFVTGITRARMRVFNVQQPSNMPTAPVAVNSSGGRPAHGKKQFSGSQTGRPNAHQQQPSEGPDKIGYGKIDKKKLSSDILV